MTGEDTPVHNVADADLRLDLRRACERLTERHREAVGLIVAGLTQQEAAEVLGVGRTAVTMRLKRARERIAKQT